MFNFIPRYIFFSKLVHHIELHFRNVWRISFVRRSIGNKLPNITQDVLFEKLNQLLGTIKSDLFCNNTENSTIIRNADASLLHEFDLLGSGHIKLEPMQWNKDLKSGYEWRQNVYYRKYGRPKGCDIKVPWELSRCHHLLWLSEAYIITGEEKYASAVMSDINDWIENNPVFYSVNWTCSMDVAIRAINWMYALNMIAGCKSMTDDFAAKVYKNLYQHGYFIFHNLEKSFPYSNNHYVSDLVGLLFLGLLFRKETRSKWYDFALSELCLETRLQVLPSGVHYEKSVSYHRLTTELLGYSYYLLKRNGETIPDDVSYRIKTMFEYVANYTKPNGLAPLIEDNDNGRLLPFVERDFREHTYLCRDSLEMRIIAIGLPVLFKENKQVTRLYEDAGIAFIHTSDAFLAVTCSGRDKYSEHDRKKKVGCHMHNDLLSFDFAVEEDDVFVDPGTYIYTSDLAKRNEFRATCKHNTVVIDGEEQNFLMKDNAFRIERNSKVDRFDLNANVDETVCEGSYKLFQSGARHRRLFQIIKNELKIEDVVEKGGKAHTVKMYFHCAEGVQPITDGQSVSWVMNTHLFSMYFDSFNETHIEIVDDTVSPSYGVLRPSKTIVVSVLFDEKTIITTNIEWTKITE